MKALLDTNILIDYLNGISKAKKEISLYSNATISIITWMEVLVGASDTDEEHRLTQYLDQFDIQAITKEIAKRAVTIRKTHKIRLPDAIIWASALELDTFVVTRNTKDFPADHPSIRIPYKI